MGFNADTDNQRVIIKVKDINDEPPYFINRPLPMQVDVQIFSCTSPSVSFSDLFLYSHNELSFLSQAVVKLNAPPNTPVFTLQSKDPDTDHNLHYFLVRDRSKIVTLVSG